MNKQLENVHQSMRGYFSYYLYQEMKQNKNVILLTGDLGYKQFDQIRDTLPDQFVNCGASEQAMLDISVGMALSGKIPFVYSITPFLLYRPFETIRTYINHEKIPVKLIGSGRDKDYSHDGISHWCEDAKAILSTMSNIKTYWPMEKEEMEQLVHELVVNSEPSFMSLRR